MRATRLVLVALVLVSGGLTGCSSPGGQAGAKSGHGSAVTGKSSGRAGGSSGGGAASIDRVSLGTPTVHSSALTTQGIPGSTVSCGSPTFCLAWDLNADGANNASTLAWVWNGTTWTATSTPPAYPRDGARAFSCPPNATVCLSGYGGYAPAVSLLSGTQWTTKRFAGPSNATDALSCLTSHDCVSVNDTLNVQTLSAAGWSAPTRGALPGTDGSSLARGFVDGIACAAIDACAVVYTNSNEVLAGWWNGRRLTLSDTQMTADKNSTPPVACASRTFCVVAGDQGFETWNGSTWSAVDTVSNEAGYPQVVTGVCCTNR